MTVVLRVNDPRPDDAPVACISCDLEALEFNTAIRIWIKSALKNYGGQVILCPTEQGGDLIWRRRPKAFFRQLSRTSGPRLRGSSGRQVADIQRRERPIRYNAR